MFFAISARQALPPLEVQVLPGKGLSVECGGIPVIQGSYLQYFKPDWSKGYYSTTYGDQTVKMLNGDSAQVSFESPDHLASGTINYRRVKDHLQVHYELHWNSDLPANIEVAAGIIWATPFRKGTLSADGKPTRSLESKSYSGDGIEPRRFSPDASEYVFSAPVGVMTESSSVPMTLFDANNYDQDYARDRDTFWLGPQALQITKDKPVFFDVDYQIDFTALTLGNFQHLQMVPSRNATSISPSQARPPLIPKPQMARLNWDKPLVYTGAFSFPAGVFDHLDIFNAGLSRRFQVPTAPAGAKRLAFDAGISKLGLVPGGYVITITDHSLTVLGEEDEGLRNGLERLAAIAYVQSGKICFPTGTIKDQPQTDWRGVHLFVGKEALSFQSKLWSRVLRPLGFNKVVLQCERTAWDSLPGTETSITMPKVDLVRLFSFYRKLGVDPIPLVQSYGHMEWLFANGKNLDLAYDPSAPYAVDPNNPHTPELLGRLWDEIIETLHPDIVHFGLDEVDMRGKLPDPATKTKLWTKQIATLASIAKNHQVEMMLWGDQGVAKEEAPDAQNGDSLAESALRRLAIPKGSYIGDWHYLDDVNPRDYRKTLQTWKDSGLRPIATTWYKPGNIAGFDVEAGRLNCGTLQSTWCGYESNERSMLDAYNQFTAMVLAADYSWSGRTEPPELLGYDPAEVFRKMYFGAPSSLTSTVGFDLELGVSNLSPFSIGDVHFGKPCQITCGSVLLNAEEGHGAVIIRTDVAARQLDIACNALLKAPREGVPVAEIAVIFADGQRVTKKLFYGMELRSADDKGSTPLAEKNPQGEYLLELPLLPKSEKIQTIVIKALNSYTGFRVNGIVAVP